MTIDGNIYTKRLWFNFAIHKFDGFHFWFRPDIICRLAFVTIAAGYRNKKSNVECFDLDSKLGRWKRF